MERIVIANREGADVYKYTKARAFKHIKHIDNPEGQLENSELRQDKPGISRGSKMKGGSPYYLDKDKSEYDNVADQFAKDLSKNLTEWMTLDSNLNLHVVAEPNLLGKIRSEMNRKPQLLERMEWIDKNLENVPQNKWVSILDLPDRPRFNHFVEHIPKAMKL